MSIHLYLFRLKFSLLRLNHILILWFLNKEIWSWRMVLLLTSLLRLVVLSIWNRWINRNIYTQVRLFHLILKTWRRWSSLVAWFLLGRSFMRVLFWLDLRRFLIHEKRAGCFLLSLWKDCFWSDIRLIRILFVMIRIWHVVILARINY